MNKFFCNVEILSKIKEFNRVDIRLRISEKTTLNGEMIMSKRLLSTLNHSNRKTKRNTIDVEGSLCIKRNSQNLDHILLFANKCML